MFVLNLASPVTATIIVITRHQLLPLHLDLCIDRGLICCLDILLFDSLAALWLYRSVIIWLHCASYA